MLLRVWKLIMHAIHIIITGLSILIYIVDKVTSYIIHQYYLIMIESIGISYAVCMIMRRSIRKWMLLLCGISAELAPTQTAVIVSAPL